MAKKVKIGRPSKKSIAMKESWKRRKAAKAKKVDTTKIINKPVTPPQMKVRVISQKDGIEVDNYEIDTLGELFDILTGSYLGIYIYEVLIQTNSTLL